MPDSTQVAEETPLPPVIVTETITEVPPPPPVPEDRDEMEPPTAVLDSETSDLIRGLVEDMDGFSATLEGSEASSAGPLVLDSDQFGVIGVGLVLILAVLTALFVATLRR